MRKALVEQLIKQDDKNTYFLTADVGFNCLEPLQEKMGNRFINVGIAEQAMVSIASGLALAGKKVYTYTMCAFYLRALEQIRNDVCYQDVPVTLIGVGTSYDYAHLGTTHFALEDQYIVSSLRNIVVATPKNVEEMLRTIKTRKNPKMPMYLRLSRFDDSKESSAGIEIVNKKKYPHEGGSPEYFVNKYG